MSRVSYEYIVPCSAEIEAKIVEYASELPVIPVGSGYSYRITVTTTHGSFYVVLLHDQLGNNEICIVRHDIDYDLNILQDVQQFFNQIAPILTDIQNAFRPLPIPIRDEILSHSELLKITLHGSLLVSIMQVNLPGRVFCLRSNLGF